LPAPDDGLAKRVARLEEAVIALRMQTDRYVRKLEEKAADAADAVIINLNDKLNMERRKNELLRNRYDQLIREYKGLSARMPDRSLPALQTER